MYKNSLIDKGLSGENQTTIGRTTLDGGIRVVTEHIPSVRSVSVGAWINTGSRDEEENVAGISHFIEHMVFKGTKKRRMHHIAQRMEAVGGYLNAFTGKEYTCYFSRSLDEHLGRAIDAISDLIINPVFPEKELEKEKEVVVEEMRMYEDTPDDYVFDVFEELVYGGHSLSRPVIGFPETVRRLDVEKLQHYLASHYTSDRLVVAVAGNAKHDDVVRLVKDSFSDAASTPGTITREPVSSYQPRSKFKATPIQQAHLVLGRRIFGVRDERKGVINVLNTILGGGMSSRLNQNIREKYGFCYSIFSFVNMLSDTGDFGIYLGVDAAKVERARKLMLRELDRLASEPVSQSRLNQAKNQLKGTLMLSLESMSNRMMHLGRMELYFQDFFTLDEGIAEIDAVTTEEIQLLSQELFDPQQMSVVALVPGTEEESRE